MLVWLAREFLASVILPPKKTNVFAQAFFFDLLMAKVFFLAVMMSPLVVSSRELT